MKIEKYVQDMIDEVRDEMPLALQINKIDENRVTGDQLIQLSVIMTLKNCTKTMEQFLKWSEEILQQYEKASHNSKSVEVEK